MVDEVVHHLEDKGYRLSSEAAAILSVIAGQPVPSGLYKEENDVQPVLSATGFTPGFEGLAPTGS